MELTSTQDATPRTMDKNAAFFQKKSDDGTELFQHTLLEEELKNHAANCINCGLCAKECTFLQKYGLPGAIAGNFSSATLPIAFECSLCGLCTAVCPPKTGLDPAVLFLEMRREAVASKVQDFSDYGGILNYEKRGTSKWYSYYALPENCDTVLFPGCTLPGTRPDKVRSLFAHLQETIPNIGMVLDCCTKPSHDLGREKHFHAMFNEMKEYLLEHGVKNILVACPNCYRVFSQYGDSLCVKTVYEHLLETSLPATANIPADITVHDPCGTRNEAHIHTAIRQIATKKSLQIREMKHHGPKTICCGEGGSVGCINGELADSWGVRRKEEAGGTRILTYCAGCANFLGAKTPTSHILDLLFDPEATLAGKAKISKAPWTYLNRLRLKRHYKKKINTPICRERTYTGENTPNGGMLQRVVLLLTLVAALVAVHMSGVTQYIEQEKLRAFIAGYGALAPVIYVLSYAVAPALFLPGLPITIAGGILFGPFWGVLYSITGATIGACIAFLVSRYIGRAWIEEKLQSSKWGQLDTMVEQHGWKAVAFTRLIPLFPFNLLNYAFGLTKVKFSHYAVTSFVCMLPACIAFIVFSSSLLEVLKGNVTPSFIIGILLIAGVSSIPFFYKQKKKENTEKETSKQKEKALNRGVGTDSVMPVLKKKGVALMGILVVMVLAALLAYKYFYYLDAYFYTYEFYWLFNVKNLQAANVVMFADFFRPMGLATEALPQIVLSNAIQNFYLPFSKPILVSAITSAFGLGLGSLFSFLGLFLVGLLSFGLGSFFLGDILPYLKKGGLEKFKGSIRRPIAISLPILFAIPLLPVSIVAMGGAALRVSFRQTTQFLLIGLSLRVGWLLSMPFLFSQ